MQAVLIIGLSTLLAVTYGILHDQITARICVEYFTIGHFQWIKSESPTVLGFFWGIFATWWVGASLGFALAVAARFGNRRKRSAKSLVRPICKLLCVMGAIAFVAGIVGYLLASFGVLFLVEPMASRVPNNRHVAFLTCSWSHSASYLVGIAGGLWLVIATWRNRDTRRSGI